MTTPHGYIEPGIRPASQREADLLRLIVRKGLCLERRGAAFVLRGPGVYVVAVSLDLIKLPDLRAQSGRSAA